MRTRGALALLALSLLVSTVPGTASASPVPDQGVIGAEVEVAYPIFPCDVRTQSCVASMTGTLSGAVAGVDGATPWAVEFDDASFAADLPYFNGTIFTFAGTCFLENSREWIEATTSVAVGGNYGLDAVTGVTVLGQLQYIRTGEELALALGEDVELVLTLSGGQEVTTVAADQWALGAGTWTVVEGALPDCSTYEDQVELTARIDGAMTMTPRD